MTSRNPLGAANRKNTQGNTTCNHHEQKPNEHKRATETTTALDAPPPAPGSAQTRQTSKNTHEKHNHRPA
eukprot:3914226-Lingulodinium_polyedra.AAC.1